jgi:hypothetical protein
MSSPCIDMGTNSTAHSVASATSASPAAFATAFVGHRDCGEQYHAKNNSD